MMSVLISNFCVQLTQFSPLTTTHFYIYTKVPPIPHIHFPQVQLNLVRLQHLHLDTTPTITLLALVGLGGQKCVRTSGYVWCNESNCLYMFIVITFVQLHYIMPLPCEVSSYCIYSKEPVPKDLKFMAINRSIRTFFNFMKSQPYFRWLGLTVPRYTTFRRREIERAVFRTPIDYFSYIQVCNTKFSKDVYPRRRLSYWPKDTSAEWSLVI